ncbi:MAG TPA: hypothetical protein VGH33_23040 [Isosphaeraceae bacterium]|jgi:hypothetical protein
MDRRRYVPPSLEGPGIELEQRQLMTGLLGVFGASSNNRVDAAPTIAIKRQRINNLPFILQSYEPRRALPPSVMAPIQDDLRQLISLIHNPGQRVLLQFNREIRALDNTKHFTHEQAQELIHAFQIELAASGTSIPLRQKFVADVTKLAAVDAGGPEPAFQLTNDMAIIAQITQVVGQPMPAPAPPALFKPENIGKHGLNITIFHRPNFTGTATPGLEIVLALSNGGIIATGKINDQGQYNVKSEWPLPDGQYKVKAYTFDQGYNGLQSGPLTFVVKTPANVQAQNPGPVDSFAVPRGPGR